MFAVISPGGGSGSDPQIFPRVNEYNRRTEHGQVENKQKDRSYKFGDLDAPVTTGAWTTNGSVLGRSSIPDRVCQQMLRHTAPNQPTFRYCTLPRGHGRVHTLGMKLCELTTVSLTAMPLPPPRCLHRAQVTTPARSA